MTDTYTTAQIVRKLKRLQKEAEADLRYFAGHSAESYANGRVHGIVRAIAAFQKPRSTK